MCQKIFKSLFCGQKIFSILSVTLTLNKKWKGVVSMKKIVVVSLLTLSMAVGSFSCVSAAALDHTSEIAVQSATDSATNNTDALQTEDQTGNTDEKVNEMMKSIENTLASSSDDISSDSTLDNGLDAIFGSLFGDSTDQMFSEMNQKLQNGEQISFSELFKNYSPLQLDSSSLFDMSDMGSLFDRSNSDMSITNLKYAVAASDMETTYAESDLSGQSGNCMDLFNSTYGDIASQMQLKTPEIPESFNVNSMLSSEADSIQKAYSSATNSAAFSSVKNNISISDIFSKARSGVSSKSLASTSTLKSMLSQTSGSNKSSVLSEYNKRKDWLSDKNSSIKQNTRKYQLQQKLAVSDADQSIIEAKKKTGRKQTENEVREEERKKGIVNFKN